MLSSVFRIQSLRKSKKMSQRDLAKKLGYKSGAAIAMWETGNRNPPSQILPRLAEVLNCTIEDLFARKDDQNGG